MDKTVVYCVMLSDYQKEVLNSIYRIRSEAEKAVAQLNETISDTHKHARYYFITERNLY